MLTATQIAALRDYAQKLTDPLNNYLIEEIARRVAEAGELTATAQYQTWAAQKLGLSQAEIKKRIKTLLNRTEQEIETLMTQSAEVGYRFDLSALPTADAIPFEENTALQRIVSAAVELAQEDFTNITQTLGMVDPYGRTLPLQQTYRSCVDFAFSQVATGAADYNTAVRNAVKNLTDKGVQSIDYASGIHTSVEAAVRRAVMGGLGLMQEQISQQTYDELGADGWEISAHAASAPDHEPIQGRQYSDADCQALNNSLVRRIGTLNCGHAAFPILLGITPPQYTKEELEKFCVDNEAGIGYGGQHYTLYEATQQQRKLERAMRTQKRRILADKATGDAEKLQQDEIRLRTTQQEYARFSKTAGLRTQYERAEVAGFGKKYSRPADNRVDVSPKSAIIKQEAGKGGADVHYITRLDIEKYKCISDRITTDEVIITDERIQHIKERRGDDFIDKYGKYFTEALTDPDYIFPDDRANTAVVCKMLTAGKETINIVLRLVVEGDDPSYKNSILTAIRENEKRFAQRLRNNTPLYKKN